METVLYFVGLRHTSNTLSPSKHIVIICRANTLLENNMFLCRRCRQNETDGQNNTIVFSQQHTSNQRVRPAFYRPDDIATAAPTQSGGFCKGAMSRCKTTTHSSLSLTSTRVTTNYLLTFCPRQTVPIHNRSVCL